MTLKPIVCFLLFAHRVESVFLNGTGRHVVMSIGHITALGIQGNFLYWINNLEGSIMRADKVIGADPVVIEALDYQATGLQVFAKERQNCKLLVRSKVDSSQTQRYTSFPVFQSLEV